jgi:hypothetical protein
MKSAYEAELEDLTTDSAGNDVLAERLRTKRGQVAQLLPMLEASPEMVAVAFHGGFFFADLGLMSELVGRDADSLPTWSALRESVELTPWAEKLADVVLGDAAGDHFLVVAACLEYLQAHPGLSSRADDEETGEEADSDDSEDGDLADDGADWLSEQGFDRRDRFSGE